MGANSPDLLDPVSLMQAATSLREAQSAPAGDTALTTAVRQAHELVSPNLYIIEQLQQAGVKPQYGDLFAVQHDEKLAALIFLSKQKLLDIEHSTLQSRDMQDARADLARYVEIIFNLQAADGLAMFFDFAAAQRESRLPELWRNVCGRCLYLLALLPASRARVLLFLEERKAARQLLEHLAETTQPAIAVVLRALLEEYRRYAGSLQREAFGEVPRYVTLARHYLGQGDVSHPEAASGYSLLLAAQDRIQQALQAGDLSALTAWVRTGSHEAANLALRQATTLMPPQQYREFLTRTLEEGGLEPVRLTALLLELSATNRAQQPHGGIPEINRILLDHALTADDGYTGVARVAVRETGSVRAFPELMVVMERAPLQPVAEEAVFVLRDLRHLVVPKSLLDQRPALQSAVRAARQFLLELQDLADSASACPTEEMAAIYIEQLKQRVAVPELQQMSQLPGSANNLARHALAELKRLHPWHLYWT